MELDVGATEWPVTLSANGLELEITFDRSATCVAFGVRSVKGRRLLATDLRLPFEQRVNEARTKLADLLGDSLDALDAQLASEGIDTLTSSDFRAVLVREADPTFEVVVDYERPHSGGRQRRDPDFYLQVAQRYAAACQRGDRAPIKAVVVWAQAFLGETPSYATAKAWVEKCRPDDLNLLTNPKKARTAGGTLTAKAKRRIKALASETGAAKQ